MKLYVLYYVVLHVNIQPEDVILHSLTNSMDILSDDITYLVAMEMVNTSRLSTLNFSLFSNAHSYLCDGCVSVLDVCTINV